MRIQQDVCTVAMIVNSVFLLGCGAVNPNYQARYEAAPPKPPEALSVGKSHYVAGEQFGFELSLRGIVGGEALMVVGTPGLVDGRREIVVRSRVESAGVAAMFKDVRDDVTTWIDLDSSTPTNYQADVKFGDRISKISTKFAESGTGDFEISFTPKGAKERILTQKMPSDQAAFDVHSALGAMRAWRGKSGEHVYFYLLAGRLLWQTTVRFTGTERVRTSYGNHDALRFDGVARRITRDMKAEKDREPRYFTLWLSDDDNRLPLLVTAKTEYGEIKAEMTEYGRAGVATAQAH